MLLTKQIHANNKSGVGYSYNGKSSGVKKTTFVKSRNTYNITKSRKVCYNIQPRKIYNNNDLYDHKKIPNIWNILVFIVIS